MEIWFWIVGWSLSILTMVGNGFIIFLVCSKRQLRTKTNAFVVSLSAADFCVGMSIVPSMYFCEMATRCNIQSDWIHIVRILFSNSSVINLCSLVVDRYIAVVKPLMYLTIMTRRSVIQMVFLSWGIPVAVRMVHILRIFVLKTPLLRSISIWITMVFCELIPCLLLIFCFISMLYVVRRYERAARTTAKQLRFNHRVSFKTKEKSAVKMMAVIIGLFLLCYGFYIRCSFKMLFKSKICNDEEYKVPLLLLNSAINPVAYAFFKRDIMKEIKRRIVCVIREA